MKRYTELTEGQQAKARENAENDMLQAVTEGAIRFNDDLNGDDLQARIDAACAEAESMRTPWFAHEYVWEACADDLRALALPVAEDAYYPEAGEEVILGIA